jgi:hypothetical protein
MRAFLVPALVAVAVLVALPTAGASCHWCGATDPVADYLRQFLP